LRSRKQTRPTPSASFRRRTCSTCLGMATTRNLPACWNVSKTTKQQFLTASCRYWLTATAIRWAVKPRTLQQRRSVPIE
jgi:Protein of unknown function (DUF3575).